MIEKILFDEKSTQFVLDALNIKTDIPIENIGGFYKGKIYEKDLFSIMELAEEIEKDKSNEKRNC